MTGSGEGAVETSGTSGTRPWMCNGVQVHNVIESDQCLVVGCRGREIAHDSEDAVAEGDEGVEVPVMMEAGTAMWM